MSARTKQLETLAARIALAIQQAGLLPALKDLGRTDLCRLRIYTLRMLKLTYPKKGT